MSGTSLYGNVSAICKREMVLTAELSITIGDVSPSFLSSLTFLASVPPYAYGRVLPTRRLRGTAFAVVPVVAVVCSDAGCAALQVLQAWRYRHVALWHLPSFQLLQISVAEGFPSGPSFELSLGPGKALSKERLPVGPLVVSATRRTRVIAWRVASSEHHPTGS